MIAKQDGFTIVEVTLFLAISGLLLLMIMIGTGTIAAHQRFTDTTDSLLVYLQSQYDNTINGVNTKIAVSDCPGGPPVSAGMHEGCLLLGRLLTVNIDNGTGLANTITSQKVISTAAVTGVETNSQERLVNSALKVLNTESEQYELKWGAVIYTSGLTRSPITGMLREKVDSIVFLRDPETGKMLRLYYDSRNYVGNISLKLRSAVSSDAGALNPPSTTGNPSAVLCVKNDEEFPVSGPRSAIFFDQGEGAGSMTTNFNTGSLCP